MLVLIINKGCDDRTTGLAEFKTKEELNNFIKVIIDLNNNCQYGCMPIIELYEISYDNIKKLPYDMKVEDRKEIVYLNGEKYVFNLKEYESIYDFEESDKDLIKKYYIEEVF